MIVNVGFHLPRHRPIGIDIRAVLDLLHGQFNREFVSLWIEVPQDGRGQKDFATGQPFAGFDDQPTNQPTGVVK